METHDFLWRRETPQALTKVESRCQPFDYEIEEGSKTSEPPEVTMIADPGVTARWWFLEQEASWVWGHAGLTRKGVAVSPDPKISRTLHGPLC
jgi:hypothetical protein